MRCHICDRALAEAEIQTTPNNKSYEPCSTCFEIAMDAAYCDGFVRDDEGTGDPDLDDLYGSGSVDTLDADTLSSFLDRSDYVIPDDNPLASY